MKEDYIVIYHITKEKTSKELVRLAVVWNRNVYIAVRADAKRSLFFGSLHELSMEEVAFLG